MGNLADKLRISHRSLCELCDCLRCMHWAQSDLLPYYKKTDTIGMAFEVLI